MTITSIDSDSTLVLPVSDGDEAPTAPRPRATMASTEVADALGRAP